MQLRGVAWQDSLNSLRYKLRATGRDPRLLPVIGNMYALRISDVPAFFGTPANIDFIFRRGAMIKLFITFSNPPPLESVMATKSFGKPILKDIPDKPTRPTMIGWRVMRNNQKLDITYWQYQDSAVLIFE